MTTTERLRAMLDSGRIVWMPGMRGIRTVKGGLMVADAARVCADDEGGTGLSVDDGWLPDLDDPATIGCLVAQLRDAWGDPGLSVGARYDSPTGLWPWSVRGGKHHGAGFRVIGIHDTEAEAIIAAFEALELEPERAEKEA